MKAFRIDFKDAERAAEKIKAAEEALYSVSDSVEGLCGRLSCEGELRARLDQVLKVQSGRICECGEQLALLGSGLDRAAARYARTEALLTGRESRDTAGDAAPIPSGHGGGGGFRGSSNAEEDGGKDFDIVKYFLGLQKKFAEGMGDEQGEKKWGLISAGASYFKDLTEFFSGQKKGLSGLSDYLHLSSSTSKVWEGLCKYIKSFDASGRIEGRFGKAAMGAGISGSVLGYLADLSEALDYKKYESPYAFYSNFIGSQEKLFDAAGDIYDAATKTEGLFATPAGLWAAFAKTVLSTGRAAGDSIVEYAKDGKFEPAEKAAVWVDASVAGLTAEFYAVADIFTFGALDTFAPKKEVAAKYISGTLKDGAAKAGGSIGKYVLEHEELLNEYNKGGIHEFTAIMKGAFGRVFGG